MGAPLAGKGRSDVWLHQGFTVGGRLWMGNVYDTGPGVGHTTLSADATMVAPNRAMTACVNPTERDASHWRWLPIAAARPRTDASL